MVGSSARVTRPPSDRLTGLDGSDVFIETKVWISDYGYDETLHAFDDKSAAKKR
jgi:diketogulonate reductase-like aldo/keto reductase